MKFSVEVPDEVFWVIASRAEWFNQRVPDYTADMLITVAESRAPVEHDPVLRLWREGWTDAEIGRRLGLTNAQVKYRRSRYRLPANRKRVGGMSVARTTQYSPESEAA